MSIKAKGEVQRIAIAWANYDREGDECEKCEHCGQWFRYDTIVTDSEGIYLCRKDFKELVKESRPAGEPRWATARPSRPVKASRKGKVK